MIRHASRGIIALGLLLVSLRGAEVPRPAPEFAFKLTNGQHALLSQYRGKVVALEFLFTTCPHCQQCAQAMDRVYKDLGPKGFQPLGVAFNENAALLVPDFIRQGGLTFPIGVGERDAVLGFLQQSPMLRFVVPQLVIIDKKGVIRSQFSGDDPFFTGEEKNLRAEVEKLLAETGGTRRSRPSSAKPKRTSVKPASSSR